jgi:hypothetical protein
MIFSHLHRLQCIQIDIVARADCNGVEEHHNGVRGSRRNPNNCVTSVLESPNHHVKEVKGPNSLQNLCLVLSRVILVPLGPLVGLVVGLRKSHSIPSLVWVVSELLAFVRAMLRIQHITKCNLVKRIYL